MEFGPMIWIDLKVNVAVRKLKQSIAELEKTITEDG